MTDEDAANLYYNRGIALFDVRRYKLAEQEFRKGILADPYHFQCLYALCISVTNNGELKEGKYLAEKFISQFPHYYQGYYLQGNVYYLQGSCSSCVEALKTGLSIEPDEENCMLLLSKAYLKLQKLSEAMDTINMAIENNPEFYEGVLLKLQIVALMSENDNGLDSHLINTLLTLGPDLASTHHVIADYYGKINKAEDAIRHYQLALRINPDDRQLKRSYNDFVTLINLGLKGPNMMFGVRIYPVDIIALGLFFLLNFYALWAGLQASGFANAKIGGIVGFICFIVIAASLFIPPLYLMFFYLKYIKKRPVKISPFSKRDIVFENYNPPLSFIAFFKLNNYHNSKIIALCFCILLLVISGIFVLAERYTRNLVSIIVVFFSLIILSQLKFKQE